MNTVVIGTFFGDESKARVVDYLISKNKFKYVCRWAGGKNAGHTIIDDNGNKTVLHLLPSCVLDKDSYGVLGQGMVIDPTALRQEILETNMNVNRLFISKNAHITMPYHIQIDQARSLSKNIGTTGSGIGPTYESKVRRTGIRSEDLINPKILAEKLEKDIVAWTPEMKTLGLEIPKAISIMAKIDTAIQLFAHRICDTAELLNKTTDSILFEGAQSALLDIDSDEYPFVTSSSSSIGGVLTGLGINHKKIHKVIGVAKAYSTRVGSGNFDAELHGELADKLREAGKEYGATTGRPRRVGWLDIYKLNKVIEMNGVDSIVLSKLDVLSNLDFVKIKVGPSDDYIQFDTWEEDLSFCRNKSDLPENAIKFVNGIEERLKCPIEYVSVGPKRNDIIEWF